MEYRVVAMGGVCVEDLFTMFGGRGETNAWIALAARPTLRFTSRILRPRSATDDYCPGAANTGPSFGLRVA